MRLFRSTGVVPFRTQARGPWPLIHAVPTTTPASLIAIASLVTPPVGTPRFTVVVPSNQNARRAPEGSVAHPTTVPPELMAVASFAIPPRPGMGCREPAPGQKNAVRPSVVRRAKPTTWPALLIALACEKRPPRLPMNWTVDDAVGQIAACISMIPRGAAPLAHAPTVTPPSFTSIA